MFIYLAKAKSSSSEVTQVIAFFGSLVFILVGAGYCFSPLLTWHLLVGWTFVNPEANEPSSAGLLFYRIIGFIAMAMGLLGLFVFLIR
jgi:hypothetical protein